MLFESLMNIKLKNIERQVIGRLKTTIIKQRFDPISADIAILEFMIQEKFIKIEVFFNFWENGTFETKIECNIHPIKVIDQDFFLKFTPDFRCGKSKIFNENEIENMIDFIESSTMDSMGIKEKYIKLINDYFFDSDQ